jgi:YegS/Rv2252/BmrU family lipid kinase
MPIKVIVNPMARKGRSGRDWQRLQAALQRQLGPFDAALTDAPGAGTHLARQAIRDGYDTLVAVGGDGTINEVVNGAMIDGAMARPDLAICPIPAGTANEMANALGHRSQQAAIDAVVSGSPRRMDLFAARCTGLAGGPGDGQVTRYGYVSSSFGAAAEISHRTSASRFLKRLGGRFSYYYVTLLVTLTYPHLDVAIATDGAPARRLKAYTGLACNLETGGGGMKLAPGARFDDGVLNLVLFKDIGRADIILQKPSWLFEGRHIEHPKVEMISGREFRIDGPASMLVDVDGETIGRLPLELTVLPGALALRA